MSAASTAYLKLADYFIRCRDNAANLPEEQEVTPYWSGVGFSLNGHRLVAPLTEVAEILSPPACARVPGAQDWVRGVANVRGRLMTVTDLNRFLERASEVSEGRRRLLVLDRDELYTGVMVDDVLGMQHFPVENRVTAPPRPEESPMAAYLDGGYRRDGEYWSVFSLARLARDPRFMRAASGE